MFLMLPQEEGDEALQHDELKKDNTAKTIMNTEDNIEVSEVRKGELLMTVFFIIS